MRLSAISKWCDSASIGRAAVVVEQLVALLGIPNTRFTWQAMEVSSLSSLQERLLPLYGCTTVLRQSASNDQ